MDGADTNARRFALGASLLSIPFVAAALWVLLGARSEVRGFFLEHTLYFVAFLSALLALIPAHELIHALAYLKGVRSSHLMMGAWIRRGMFYAMYDAPLPRHRVLVMSAMPFLLLSAMPAICLPWLEIRHELRVVGWFLVLLHTSLCTGDFFVWWRLLFRVPRGASIHNNSWTTYWTTEHARAA
jgi:hypothetical protein